MGYKIPSKPSALSGKTRGKITAFKEVSSKFGAQIQFEFTTDVGNRLHFWMTIESAKQVEFYLSCGVLRPIGDDEFEVVPIPLQKKLWLTLDKGKVTKIEPVQ